MLVLSRRVGEKILIGNSVVITVTEIVGNRCRLGIEAPPQVSIDRAEVRERKNNEGVTGALKLRAARFADRIPRGAQKVA